MLDLLHLGKLPYQIIVQTSEGVYYLSVRTVGLHAYNDLIAFLPACHKFFYHLRWILKIRRHKYGGVPVRLQHAVIWAVELSEIFCVEYGLYMMPVLTAHAAEYFPCIVMGIVIHEKYVVVILFKDLRCLKSLLYCSCERLHVILLVITWNYNADLFHRPVSTIILISPSGLSCIILSPSGILSKPLR